MWVGPLKLQTAGSIFGSFVVDSGTPAERRLVRDFWGQARNHTRLLCTWDAALHLLLLLLLPWYEGDL